MALPMRSLDDRSFQEIVDEAKKKIPLYCPEWTDHNVSDPGVTLIELFAWMIDVLLFRLNQIPHKHHVRLLELLGIDLEPPRAARAPLTFYLSAPQPHNVVVPRGMAVTTSRADGGEVIFFSTGKELTIRPATLNHVIVRRRMADGSMRYQEIGLRLQREFTPFTPESPQEGEAIFFGFDEPLDRHYIGIDITCLRAGGLSIIPESPPVVWQAWTEQGWYEVDVEEDGTGGMSWSGQILLHLPEMAQREVNGVPAYWVRCELVTPNEDQLPYETSPELTNVGAATWGATVEAYHATEVVNEPLGRSDGSPGQIFHLQQTPVLPRQGDERLEIWGPGMEDWEPWTEVPELNYSGSNDKHYTLDGSTGETRLGPALRLRDGSVQRYGTIPSRGAEVRFSRYRYGGSTAGNVRRGSLNELRTSLAYIDHVANREDATGGLDQETLEHAMFRAQALLRTRFRAVTAADYEYLTLQRFPEIARVLCLQTRLAGRRAGALSPGRVYVIVVPGLPEEEARRYIPLSRLAIPDELRERINAYLNERRPLTAQLEARAAGYRRVRAEVVVIGEPGVDERQLARDIITALELLINPLVGGPDGTGWPFGRELYLSDLYACVQQVKGLRYVHEIRLGWVDESETLHPVERKIELLAHEVLVSDRHQVRVEFE